MTTTFNATQSTQLKAQVISGFRAMGWGAITLGVALVFIWYCIAYFALQAIHWGVETRKWWETSETIANTQEAIEITWTRHIRPRLHVLWLDLAKMCAYLYCGVEIACLFVVLTFDYWADDARQFALWHCPQPQFRLSPAIAKTRTLLTNLFTHHAN